jgi:3-dehydroquinate dehydratase II
MSFRVLVLNGPNINMLGKREPALYGSETLRELEDRCRKAGSALDLQVECEQYNSEGALVDAIQKARDTHDGIVINAAAFTHTSVAVRDALSAAERPVIEVHLSNVYARESFRHVSYISSLAVGVIIGFGSLGYQLALRAMVDRLRRARAPSG